MGRFDAFVRAAAVALAFSPFVSWALESMGTNPDSCTLAKRSYFGVTTLAVYAFLRGYGAAYVESVRMTRLDAWRQALRDSDLPTP